MVNRRGFIGSLVALFVAPRPAAASPPFVFLSETVSLLDYRNEFVFDDKTGDLLWWGVAPVGLPAFESSCVQATSEVSAPNP